jgi:hypothetical protein
MLHCTFRKPKYIGIEMVWRAGVRIPAKRIFFSFFRASRPTLGLTQFKHNGYQRLFPNG